MSGRHGRRAMVGPAKLTAHEVVSDSVPIRMGPRHRVPGVEKKPNRVLSIVQVSKHCVSFSFSLMHYLQLSADLKE